MLLNEAVQGTRFVDGVEFFPLDVFNQSEFQIRMFRKTADNDGDLEKPCEVL